MNQNENESPLKREHDLEIRHLNELSDAQTF